MDIVFVRVWKVGISVVVDFIGIGEDCIFVGVVLIIVFVGLRYF